MKYWILHEAIDMSIDDILCLSTDVHSIRWPIDPIDPSLWGAMGPSVNIKCIDLNNYKPQPDRVGGLQLDKLTVTLVITVLFK